MNSGSWAFDRLRQDLAFWVHYCRDKAMRERIRRWLELTDESEADFAEMIHEAKAIGLNVDTFFDDSAWTPSPADETDAEDFLWRLRDEDANDDEADDASEASDDD